MKHETTKKNRLEVPTALANHHMNMGLQHRLYTPIPGIAMFSDAVF